MGSNLVDSWMFAWHVRSLHVWHRCALDVLSTDLQGFLHNTQYSKTKMYTHTTHKTLTRPEVIEYAALLITAENGLNECLSQSDPISFPLAHSVAVSVLQREKEMETITVMRWREPVRSPARFCEEERGLIISPIRGATIHVCL